MNRNSVSGGLFLVFSLLFIYFGTQIPPSSFKQAVIGPKVFPITIGILLALASAALMIKGIIEARQKPLEEKKNILREAEEEEEEAPQDIVRLGVILVMLLAYFVLFSPLGYVLSTALFIFCLSMYLDKKHWKRNLTYAVVFPLIVFLLFNEVLAVYLPTGPFS
ncbi:tripartite tricarboxylate transporter TctB family protein [Ammoniphilus resinae]|uniref:Tricarboxylic transport membrane protein n=1 Tax=Ammoniphilus resinae TaxID=861532 RepID=A0ABS4GMH2_9BACL|nr:tripartite tricarboxylate transporter TctB family protein [Ammoniphilus resinae]MBP1931302.1 putative tricarboxylic transport membrane protein [Ammoniphilus resinae]